MFTEKDIRQIEGHGLSVEAVERQIEHFKAGFPYLDIDSAARVGDGILSVTGTEAECCIRAYETACDGLKIVKFVPASGAATRMFKELFAFLNEGKRGKGIDTLLEHIDRFAFYDRLREALPAGADDRAVVSAIVGPGLEYGSKPKGQILFHKYDDGARTAVEEHLVEGAKYAACDGRVNLHLTVSPEHMEGFKKLLAEAVPRYEARYGVRYEVSYSVQKPSTDTVAVNPDNTPFRNDDGSLLFRPAGHGALIENLNDIDADLIFIKTIDNVTTDHLRGDTVRFKKMLGGMLVMLRESVYAFAGKLAGACDEQTLQAAAKFAERNLCVKLPEGFAGRSAEERRRWLAAFYDRPLRVCGMVVNEGEPGGGPFWVKNADGSLSLQIAESSQIAPEDARLMKEATHFNPVDIVCGVKDRTGRKFDLRRYTDPQTGFISSKSKDGRELKAQELPGLWNGAMADWITVFVEVPISTFSPVKVVQDLLRPQHQ